MMSDTTRCLICTAPVGEDGRWYPGEEMAHGYDAGRKEEEQARAAKLHGMTATMQQWRTLAGQMTDKRDMALAEVMRLREMILYALDGPDVDLPEEHGGRAVAITKKVLRDALSEVRE